MSAGRPRDPELAGRMVDAAIGILAGEGLHRLTADAVAAAAGAGKASLYRRWRTLDELLVTVVAQLGVGAVEHGVGPGTLREDLARLLHAAATGPAAAAEAAVMSAVASSMRLQAAYAAGPRTRLCLAASRVEVRGRRRGEPEWSSYGPVLAGHAFLLQQRQIGEPPDFDAALRLVDDVVLPALRGAS